MKLIFNTGGQDFRRAGSWEGEAPAEPEVQKVYQ